MSRFGGGNRSNLNARECVLGAMGSMCACSEVFFWWYLKAREPLTCGLYCRYRDIDQDIKKDALSVFERFVYKLVQILLKVALKSVQFIIFVALNNVQKLWIRYCRYIELSWI